MNEKMCVQMQEVVMDATIVRVSRPNKLVVDQPTKGKNWLDVVVDKWILKNNRFDYPHEYCFVHQHPWLVENMNALGLIG